MAEDSGVVLDCDGMLIDHAIEGVVGLLKGHPVAQGAEEIAHLERVGGRLDAGEDTRGVGHSQVRHGLILAASPVALAPRRLPAEQGESWRRGDRRVRSL